MERVTWKGRIMDGMLDEYIRRHNEIWPEMKQMFSKAGMRNYSIWNVGNELFGYYECDDAARAADIQANSEVSHRWREYMKGFVQLDINLHTGEKAQLRQVFLFEGNMDSDVEME